MKKTAVCLLLAFALAAAYFPDASAAPSGGGFQAAPSASGGGFSGPGIAVSTVQEVKAMRDDAHVVMRGTIVRHLGKDKYLFKDDTGTITVEIDHDKWGGLTVTPDDTVNLYGEVDKDWNSVEVDVDTVVLAK